jgi:subtilisin family serine protease
MLSFRLVALALVVIPVGPAMAQVPDIGGVVGTVGGVLNEPLGQVENTARDATRGAVQELREARETAMRQLRRDHGDVIDTDRDGAIVIRSEVVAIAPSAQALAAARDRGFTVRETVEADALGLHVVVLSAPRGLSTRRAVEMLRELDPDGAYDFNHIYLGSGSVTFMPKQAARSRGAGGGRIIGLIDSGIDADHPAFGGVSVNQRGFGGQAITGAHGTAVASLLVGAAPDASLMVADVYGGRPTGGGASSIVAALGWLAQSRATVINVSLVGPRNRALEAAVQAAIARGHVVVAAVGNDGPAAPPLYPAAYAGVVGVTGVDARDRVLPEAGRGVQVDFAAPGNLSAASAGGRYANVRGTSYAAPIVAGLIAQRMSAPDANAAAEAQVALARTAVDLGARGADRIYGVGLVGRAARVAARR